MNYSGIIAVGMFVNMVSSVSTFAATAPGAIRLGNMEPKFTLADCHNEDDSGYQEGSLGISPNSPFDGGAVIVLANCHTERANNPHATDHGTVSITDALALAERLCRQVPDGYKIDCLAVQYAAIARWLPKGGDYGVVYDVLNKASEDLHQVAKDNRDRYNEKKDFTVQLDGRRKSVGKPIHSIRPGAQASANVAAIQIIQEAQTVLLRSTENSSRRQVHYQRIATAIDSNKVLLRS